MIFNDMQYSHPVLARLKLLIGMKLHSIHIHVYLKRQFIYVFVCSDEAHAYYCNSCPIYNICV